MYVLNVTDDYDNVTLNDNDNITLSNCTKNENNIDIFIPTLLFTIPCGLSILYVMSLMIHTLLKPLFNNKWWRSFFTQIIQFTVF